MISVEDTYFPTQLCETTPPHKYIMNAILLGSYNQYILLKKTIVTCHGNIFDKMISCNIIKEIRK